MSDNTRQFVSSVISGGMINVPNTFADHHDLQKDDTVELRIVSHKRDGEEIYSTEESE
ncbi:MAG: hypothetical protein ABEH81_01355 [Halopenitus sp.]